MSTSAYRRTGLMVLCLALAGGASLAEEGWKLKIKAVDADGQTSMLEALVGEKHLNVRMLDGPDGFILAPDRMTSLRYDTEKFQSMTFDELEAMSGQIQGAGGLAGIGQAQAEALAKGLEGLDPQSRAAAEKYLKGMNIPGMAQPEPAPQAEDQWELKRGSGTKTVAGLASVEHTVWKNDRQIGEVWITDKIATAGIVGTIRRFAELAPASMQTGADLELYGRLGGFPTLLVDRESDQTFEVLEASRTTLTEQSWLPPAGFTPGL